MTFWKYSDKSSVKFKVPHSHRSICTDICVLKKKQQCREKRIIRFKLIRFCVHRENIFLAISIARCILPGGPMRKFMKGVEIGCLTNPNRYSVIGMKKKEKFEVKNMCVQKKKSESCGKKLNARVNSI